MNGTGNFSDENVIDIISGSYPRRLFVIDLNNDVLLDVIVCYYGIEQLVYYQYLGNKIFGNKQIIATTIYGIFSVFAIDLNDDQLPDVVACASLSKTVFWFKVITVDCSRLYC